MDKIGLTPSELIEILKTYDSNEHLRFLVFTDTLDNEESNQVCTVEKVTAIIGKGDIVIGATIMGVLR